MSPNVIKLRPDESIPSVRPPEIRNEGGWLRSQRRIWHHDSMLTDFQEIAAWAYLYHVAEPLARPRSLSGREVYAEEGDVITSIAFLAGYWGWHRDRVRRFLGRLIVARRIAVNVVFPDGSERAMGAQSPRNGRAIGLRVKVLNHKAYSSSENNTARNGKAIASDQQGCIEQKTRDTRLGSPSDSELDLRTQEQGEPLSPDGDGPSPKKSRSQGAKPDLEPYRQAWNEICGEAGLPRCEVITGKRESALRARLSEPLFRADERGDALAKWRAFCKRVVRDVGPSPDWSGAKPSIDWATRPNTPTRIKEGCYGGTRGGDSSKPPLPAWSTL